MKKIAIRTINFFIPRRILLIFLTGFFLACSLFFKVYADYNNELFRQLGDYILEQSKDTKENPQKVALRAMNTVYKLQEENRKVLFHYAPHSFKSKYMRSTDMELLDVSGGCGSASLVLGRTLLSMGYPIRFAQMKANGYFGAHILIEIWTNGKWIVLDPSYNQYFVKPDSSLASFDDVKNNFNYYTNQLVKDYPTSYKFEDARYTNWNKIPLLGPLCKNTLSLIYGEERVNGLSLRKYFINFYAFWGKIFTVSFICCFSMSLIQWYIERKKLKKGA